MNRKIAITIHTIVELLVLLIFSIYFITEYSLLLL